MITVCYNGSNGRGSLAQKRGMFKQVMKEDTMEIRDIPIVQKSEIEMVYVLQFVPQRQTRIEVDMCEELFE